MTARGHLPPTPGSARRTKASPSLHLCLSSTLWLGQVSVSPPCLPAPGPPWTVAQGMCSRRSLAWTWPRAPCHPDSDSFRHIQAWFQREEPRPRGLEPLSDPRGHASPLQEAGALGGTSSFLECSVALSPDARGSGHVSDSSQPGSEPRLAGEKAGSRSVSLPQARVPGWTQEKAGE